MTKAIEIVSAVKMKKAQLLALGSRPFAEKSLEILRNLSNYQKELEEGTIYFKEGKGDITLAGVITSDKGFCGSFNRNILNFFNKEAEKEGRIEIFAVGKKAIDFLKKKNYKILFEFLGIGDYAKLNEVKPIADIIVRYFKMQRFKKILLFYTDFVSTFCQKPVKIQLLPLNFEKLKEILKNYKLKNKESVSNISEEKIIQKIDYILEPSAKEIFENIVPQLIEYLIYHSILEANASEHSARMIAMRSASENAKEFMEKLRLQYNKARQAQITAEVLEVSMAKEVLE